MEGPLIRQMILHKGEIRVQTGTVTEPCTDDRRNIQQPSEHQGRSKAQVFFSSLPREETTPPASHLGFQASELRDDEFLLRPRSWRCLVTAALLNQCKGDSRMSGLRVAISCQYA